MILPALLAIAGAGLIPAQIAVGQDKSQSTGGQESANKKTVKKTAKKSGPRNVAVLIFDGVELLDFAGPAEVFIVCEYGRSYNVYTVADQKQTVRTMGGIQIVPNHDLKSAPQPDVLIIPGGSTSNLSSDARKWLRTAHAKTEITMSVCMGAFVLAEADLLDGVKATTHRWGIESLKRAAPKCQVVEGQRFVDNGKIITTGGVTAGIDGALHIVERLNGAKAARWTADEWMEYRRSGKKLTAPADGERTEPGDKP
jgi:transcriptional regulator GlxA family with amidase domain